MASGAEGYRCESCRDTTCCTAATAAANSDRLGPCALRHRRRMPPRVARSAGLGRPSTAQGQTSVPHERARLRCVGGNCGPRLPRGVAGGTRLSRHASTASPHTCAARCTAGTAGAARLGAGKAAAPLRSTLAAMMGPLARRPSTGCHEGPVPVAILNFGSLKRSEAPLGQHPATVKPSCSR